jgi:hypothetical protein
MVISQSFCESISQEGWFAKATGIEITVGYYGP